MIKKTLSLVLLACLALTLFISAPISSEKVQAAEVLPESILYVPCPVGPGRCNMNPAGYRGYLDEIVDGNRIHVLTHGFVYQCPQCYNAVVCEVDPGFGYLGTYVLFNPGESLSPAGTHYTAGPGEIGYNSSIAGTYYLQDCIW